MAPFYQYEFFTHPEFFSKTGAGPDAKFGEASAHDLEVNAQSLHYLETQSLQIYVVDDAPNMSGMARGGQGTGDETDLDDLIGICSIPLAKIASGQGIDGEFEVRDGNESRGKLVVRIAVLDTLRSQVHSQDQQRTGGLGYQTRY